MFLNLRFSTLTLSTKSIYFKEFFIANNNFGLILNIFLLNLKTNYESKTKEKNIHSSRTDNFFVQVTTKAEEGDKKKSHTM